MTKAPTAKQLAARKLFAERARSGFFRRGKASTTTATVKVRAPRQRKTRVATQTYQDLQHPVHNNHLVKIGKGVKYTAIPKW